jgi:hypothetical protein
VRSATISVAALAALLVLSFSARAAEEPQPPATQGEATPAEAAKEPELTPEEKAEKEARKACKAEICDIFATRDPNGPDISCDIKKTWRESAITNMLGGKIAWPYGKAVCQSKLELRRADLAKAMSESKYEMNLPAQKLRCTLAQKEDGEPYAIEVSIAPKVTFENGKAVRAKLNWGEASAPMLVYALIYAGTGLDNSANVLGPEVVHMVNEFTTKKCAEVKAELSGTKQD